MKKLRIAILPHLGRPVTPEIRAARSRVIYDLICGLVKNGHDVSLIGTADSKTPAKNIPVAPTGVFLMDVTENDFYRHTSYLTQAIKKVEELQDNFDIVHSHMYPEFLPLFLGSQLRIPMLTTIHAEMKDYLVEALKRFPQSNIAAISKQHQKDADGANIKYVVYNGIDFADFPYCALPQDYLLFIGRIKIVRKQSGEIYDPKGILTAIEVAEKSGEKLLFSGSIETQGMFDEFLKPHLSEKIQFIGKISKEAPLIKEEVVKLYGGAKALLCPIHWSEPFGLVMIEANACGTPVIAFNRGSAPELIREGINGYVVNNTQEMVDALGKIKTIDRKKCHEYAKENFTREKMTQNYENIYYQLIS